MRAQAVVSRTYAVRNLGRWRADGFDLQPTVADQVYGGVGAETAEARDAVRRRSGQILAWGGQPIDAFFFSTCGGRTADGAEVFRGADRPYLRSVPDLDPNGTPYCSISPRFRWHEEWSGEALRNTVLRRSLPAVAWHSSAARSTTCATSASRPARGRDGWDDSVLRRRSNRIRGRSADSSGVAVHGGGQLLRSNTFTLTVTRGGGRVTRLVAEGAGVGHGVGFCQWGAVGRSRGGTGLSADHRGVLLGRQLERLY